MSDDIKLSEGDSINLDEKPLDGDINLPKSDDSDFDLDKFLAENAVEDTADVDLNLAQNTADFAALFDDKETAEVADVSLDDLPEVSSEKEEIEPELEPVLEPEIGDEAEVETEPISEERSEVEFEPEAVAEKTEFQKEEPSEPEEKNIFETGVVAEDEEATPLEEDFENVEDVLEDERVETSFAGNTEDTEEDVVNGKVSKGWAFEGLEDVAGSEEDEASSMNDDGFSGFEVEGYVPAEKEQENNSDVDYGQKPTNFEGSNQSIYDLQETNSYARWYSGNYDERAFEVDKQSTSGVLDGDDEFKTIHVNVGYDTYGWQVEFANGIMMNLRDVREYQLKNGALPAEDGAIVYGDVRIDFNHIKKITLYESVRYFTYMPN